MIGTIGRDLRLTDALHERLRHQPAQNDWRDPVVMRAKVAAWRNANKPDAAQRVPTNNHGGVMIDALACLGCAGLALLLLHLLSQYVLQTGSF